MAQYTPDLWQIVKITPVDTTKEPYFRIMACWYGGFTKGDSWKLSSGIVEIKDAGDFWEVPNHSGSVYFLGKNAQGMSGYGSMVLQQLKLDSLDHVTITECEIEHVRV